MRWPYDKRLDVTPGWQLVGLGVSVGGIIIGALVALHGGWSPTARGSPSLRNAAGC